MEMETQKKMINILDEVVKEKSSEPEYPDEVIVSNLYYVSLSFSLRSLAGMREDERKRKQEKNGWLENETKKIHDIQTLDFDNITKKLTNGKTSCDAFFYNFMCGEEEQHFLCELKNVDKKTILNLLNDEGKDGVYNKVKDSVQMIKTQLLFGGNQENDKIIQHTHFLVIYSGKNNVPSKSPVKMVGKTKVGRDASQKQCKAARISVDSEKKDLEIYDRFGEKIIKLGLQYCCEDVFPGDALPRAKKILKGGEKVRAFSIFSANDFAKIIDSDFFASWKWGEYQDNTGENVIIVNVKNK